MAYVVARPKGRYEIRQARATGRGPRSRALATFRVLNDEVVRHAESRADGPLDPSDLRRSARRAGAPVEAPAADARSGALLGALARGGRPTPVRARLLAHALAPDEVAAPADHLQAASEWAGADQAERGAALRDLLTLVDAVPVRVPRRGRPSFPRLSSAPA
jgi:hypothetical protein